MVLSPHHAYDTSLTRHVDRWSSTNDMDGGRSDGVPAVENDFYYSVLNLTKTATQSEITERYRALSLIFHPDKQQDEEYKSIATKKFLEVQKAYEGEEGLTVVQSSQLQSMPREEAKKILLRIKGDKATSALHGKGLSGGSLICGIDVISLFSPYLGSEDDTWMEHILHRLEDVKMLTFGLQHMAQKSINERTELSVKAKMMHENRKLANTLVGTFSVGLIPKFMRVSGTYNMTGTVISANLSTPFALRSPDPSLKFSVSRQLFRRRLETASFEVDVGRRPRFAFNLVFPKVFGVDFAEISEEPKDISGPPSASGLKNGTTHTLIGFSFDSILPKLLAEWGLNFSELALQLNLALEFGLTGLAWVCTGKWSPSPTTSFSAATHLHAAGVVLQLSASYHEQELSVPIVLSTEYDPGIALCTTVLPSTAFVLGYHFIIKPRRRKHRLDSIYAARRNLEDDMGIWREREAISNLLKDTARKSKTTEAPKGGLVIVEATWGSMEKEDGARDLVIDVTVPLQALVHTSQLYIPADRLKSEIRGFSDPAPFTRKALCVRYLFRGKTHYAEISEDLPVVLPLADYHLAVLENLIAIICFWIICCECTWNDLSQNISLILADNKQRPTGIFMSFLEGLRGSGQTLKFTCIPPVQQTLDLPVTRNPWEFSL
ncbi:hypothetical protein D9615_004999 [Tricholomella constricta]|uniref:J domain-containing protein n=1 Tax=Tricholomella constricta TaxID=117010 RepID=A0A8H5HHS5_9AGAR|nr:hypothetical protein D9615_004999 [Tricholomella constricta]